MTPRRFEIVGPDCAVTNRPLRTSGEVLSRRSRGTVKLGLVPQARSIAGIEVATDLRAVEIGVGVADGLA
jgi:hypothetical protein